MEIQGTAEEHHPNELKKFLNGALEDIKCFLFPPSCIICGCSLPSGSKIVCNDCRKTIFTSSNSENPFCPVCRSSYSEILDKCPKCQNRRSPGKLYALSELNSALLSYIHAFKYHQRYEIGIEFAEWGYQLFKEHPVLPKIDLIIPVPLHRKKELSRGYNQAEVFAHRFAELTEIPINDSALKRIRNTKSQTHLNYKQRLKNVKGAFKVIDEEAVKRCKILLLDDVVTTGATLYECSKVLKGSGAKEVFSLIVGRHAGSY